METMDSGINRFNRAMASADWHIGKVTYPPGGKYGPINQSMFQVVGILKGRMEVYADENAFLVEEHECCLLFPGQRVTLVFDSQIASEHNWCGLSTQLMPKELLKDITPDNCKAPDSLQFNSIIDLVLDLSHTTNPHARKQFEHLALGLMYEFHRLLIEPAIEPSHKAISRAFDYIQSHYMYPINVEDVAKEAGLSRQYLTKLFREQTGRTMRECLWTFRIEKARSLLIDTGLQLSEIAERTGFQNAFHLSRKIKLQYGLSPKELRSQAWKKGL